MLVRAEDVCVVIFNMQLQLIPLLHQGTQLLNDCCWIADVSRTLRLPTLIVEHKKLGDSSVALKEVAGEARYVEKHYFDFTVHEHIAKALTDTGRRQFVIAGAESHVCILQSAFGLRDLGRDVFVLVDAISARGMEDHARAVERMRAHGIHLMTKEMFFFECVRHSEYPEYIPTAMRFLDGRYIR